MQPAILVYVVEDDALISLMVEEALKDGGFAVATAADGADAMRLLDAPDADCRALVADVNLAPGGLTGWDVARRARELHSDIPVVYMTGSEAHEWTSQGVPNSVLVPKPFAAAQIVTAVSQLLNQGNTPGA